MASLFGRAARAGARASQRLRGGAGPPGGWWGPGTQSGRNGNLFGETPLPPGVARKWEDWELPWYLTMGTATVMLAVGLNSQPDTTITTWARKEALARLAAEGDSAAAATMEDEAAAEEEAEE
eukprot:jgi/Chlat1/8728/Chrsp9S08557